MDQYNSFDDGSDFDINDETKPIDYFYNKVKVGKITSSDFDKPIDSSAKCKPDVAEFTDKTSDKYIKAAQKNAQVDKYIEENSNLFDPQTPYASTKLSFELLLKNYQTFFDFPLIISRFSNFYGPGQPLHRLILIMRGACRKEDDSFSPRLKPLSFFAWCAADPVSSGADLPQPFSQKTLEGRPAQARERPRLTRTSWESRWLGTIVVILSSSLRCHFWLKP